MNRIVSAMLVGLAFTPFLTGNARAQIIYDAANRAYFVTSDATIKTDVSGNEVFVGKDNATNFSTLPGPITLNVTIGAIITGFGNNAYPDQGYYNGLNVFGDNFANISGGAMERVLGYNASSVNISGGTMRNVLGYNASALKISGGTMRIVNGHDTSAVKITGGTVNSYVEGYETSAVKISGGTVKAVSGRDASSVSISGGTVYDAYGYSASSVGISGGMLNNVYGSAASALNISGGTVSGNVVSQGACAVNISGGRMGRIYELGGTLNLYGSGFARTGISPGNYLGIAGTFSTLTGILLDGAALNVPFFLADGVTYTDLGGGAQSNPILPDANSNNVFTFNNVPSGAWVDPPSVGSYQFAMLGGDSFTSILDFPAGIGDTDGLFTVSVGGKVLGQFSSGAAVNFADFGFASGVPGFTISGINPTVDGGNPTAFPIKLAFSAPFASFTMTGITGAAAAPEPGTLLLLVPVVGFAALRRKRA